MKDFTKYTEAIVIFSHQQTYYVLTSIQELNLSRPVFWNFIAANYLGKFLHL